MGRYDETFLQGLDYSSAIVNRLCRAYLDRGVRIIGVSESMLNRVPTGVFSEIEAMFSTCYKIVNYHRAEFVVFAGDCAGERMEEVMALSSDATVVGVNSDIVRATEASERLGKYVGIGLPRSVFAWKEGVTEARTGKYLRLRETARVFISTGCEVPYGTALRNFQGIVKQVRLVNGE